MNKIIIPIISVLPEIKVKLEEVKVFSSLDSLQPYIDELVTLYINIFGEYSPADGSTWGEGAFCSKEGRTKKISIKEYNRRVGEKQLLCECGGTFLPYHSREDVIKRIEGVFPNGNVVLIFEKGKIVGFAWGSIVLTSNLSEKINNNLAFEFSKEKIIKMIKQIHNEQFIYFEEIGIERLSRTGIKSILRLVIPLLKIGESNLPILFRTERGSKIYLMSKEFGFKQIGELNNYFVFINRKSRGLRKVLLFLYWLNDKKQLK